MAKLDELNRRIDEAGLKRSYIAAKIGISPQSLFNKLTGKAPLKASEMMGIAKVLQLDDHETVNIFLRN